MPWFSRTCTWCGCSLAATTDDPDVRVVCVSCDPSDLPLIGPEEHTMDSNLEPDHDDVVRAYPHWSAWKGIDGMCYGRSLGPWPLTARGEDWQDLLDQIRRAEATLADARPGGWPL